jgi:hypothetical protein
MDWMSFISCMKTRIKSGTSATEDQSTHKPSRDISSISQVGSKNLPLRISSFRTSKEINRRY